MKIQRVPGPRCWRTFLLTVCFSSLGYRTSVTFIYLPPPRAGTQGPPPHTHLSLRTWVPEDVGRSLPITLPRGGRSRGRCAGRGLPGSRGWNGAPGREWHQVVFLPLWAKCSMNMKTRDSICLRGKGPRGQRVSSFFPFSLPLRCIHSLSHLTSTSALPVRSPLPAPIPQAAAGVGVGWGW